ncbi:kinase-like domain-containing protein [Tribonema minus]|uniref:Kinase-like domain-containing protein n=1 Tax=Tribonema minus TaxID=303371 RepID=A0A835ZEQ5_9STRA|nr:kinase-like domain-containing protein [Tribonema minus]
MGNTAGGGGLPFDVGEEIMSYSRSSQGHWKMHKGVKRANGETVSIFRLAKKGTSPLAVEAGQRGFQKLRSLRHPYILACLDGAELDTDVVMATEEVVPLGDWLATRIEAGKKDDQIAWGMHCMCAALKFLHESCKQSHNNVCADTIFVTRGGDWKLGGMDLLSALDGSDNFLQIHQSIQVCAIGFVVCPERLQGSMHTLANLPLHIQDIWSLGRVLQVAYPEGTPPSLSKYVEKMMDARPERRPTPSQYLRCAFLKRPAVQHLQQLEDWSVASAEEKGTFLRGGTAIAACPRDALRHKLSALLLRDIEMAMAAAAAAPGGGGGAGGTRAVVATALPPLLDIEREAADAALSARVQPLLVALFTMNDRGVRAMLLSKVDAIAPRLDAATVNARLFDPLCAGFTDAAAQLRELTLKSMVVFTDKLSDKNMNDKLIRHLARLQGDPEDSIRTNTIIFLGKIAGKLKPAVRDKVLLPAFARGIRDPFPAARLAGLRATAACAAYCEPMDVCTRVLPVVMPCLVDQASHAVREAAFACVELYLAKVRRCF